MDGVLTLNSHICVRVKFGSCSPRSLCSFIFVIACDLISVVVYEYRVIAYNLSLVACVINRLPLTSAIFRGEGYMLAYSSIDTRS